MKKSQATLRHRLQSKKWYYSHHEERLMKKQEHRRDYRFEVYGLTNEQWEQMFIAQKGLCAICGDWLKFGISTHVDHDHRTKKIRGLLCSRCNAGIGMLRESEHIITQAQQYLASRR